MQRAHERDFFECRQAAEVEPVAVRAVLVVVAQVFDVSEACSPEAIELESNLVTVCILREEHVTLFAHAYLATDARDDAAAGEGVEGEVVVAAVPDQMLQKHIEGRLLPVLERVAIICFPLVLDQLGSQQRRYAHLRA